MQGVESCPSEESILIGFLLDENIKIKSVLSFVNSYIDEDIDRP